MDYLLPFVTVSFTLAGWHVTVAVRDARMDEWHSRLSERSQVQHITHTAVPACSHVRAITACTVPTAFIRLLSQSRAPALLSDMNAAGELLEQHKQLTGQVEESQTRTRTIVRIVSRTQSQRHSTQSAVQPLSHSHLQPLDALCGCSEW